MPLTSGYNTLSEDINKVGKPDDLVSALLPELTLEMSDEELIALKKSWIKNWEPYKVEIEKKQKVNEDYWLGQQFNPNKSSDNERPLVDNLIFESLETFLPIATRAKAEPLVESDNTEEGNALADKVRKMILYVADNLSFNLKMKQVARYWALHLLGVIKVGWSVVENDITCKAIRASKLVLDTNSTIDGCQYDGYYIGEYLDDMASDLVLRFPEKAEFIKDKVKDNMGTKVSYIMWTTNEYVFWTLDNEVLGKNKNPHWNYDSEEEQPITDEFGQQTMQTVPIKGNNHFNSPQMPYVFLSVFNLGKQPHDDTNLIQQNLPLQDLVNKRLAQIDMNADNANNGIALSGDAFTEEQAMKAAHKRRKGAAFWVPTGDVNAAIKELPAQPLPNFIYESLLDYKNSLRDLFGVRGSTPQGTIREQTLGGKEIIKGQDADRIGGGVSTYLEQFSDRVFNWFVQLMYVYYDEPHAASVVGVERAKEYITLVNSEFTSKLTIGVKEGSMVPRDPASQRGEAVELWAQQGIDPITFFTRLEFPNPREAAKQLYLWQADPIQLFPDLLAEQQAQQAQQMQQQQVMQQEQLGQDQNLAEEEQDRELEKVEFANLVKQP